MASSRRARPVAVAAMALVHCTPPPPTLAFEGARRDAVGSLSAGGYVSYTGDYTSRTSVGSLPSANTAAPSALGDVRVSGQVERNVSMGLELAGGGSRNDTPSPLGVVLLRGHAQFNADSDHFAIVLGAGAGSLVSSTGAAGLLTGDFGMRAGFDIARRVDVVLSETLTATLEGANGFYGLFHTITDVGLIGRVTPRLGLGGFVSVIWGFNADGAMNRAAFVPSLAVRYVVDGAPVRAHTVPDAPR